MANPIRQTAETSSNGFAAARGDVLVIFTDGVVEAENAAGEELGDGPLAEVVLRLPQAGAEGIFEALLVEAFQHLGDGKFRDDVTLVVIKRMG